jgi:hypothetical protein
MGVMKSPALKKIDKQKALIKDQLAGRTVSPQKVETVGKALYELAKIFATVEKNR